MANLSTGAVHVTVVGDAAWRATLQAKHHQLGDAVERGIERGLILLQGDMQKRTGGTGMGRRELARMTPVPKPAAPAVLWRRSSTLHGSFHYQLKRRGISSSGTVGTPIEYAKAHELGLLINSGRGYYIKMPKRPFVAPALEDNREEVVQGIRREIESVVRA